MSDEQRKPFYHRYKFEFYFKNGKEKHIRLYLEREQADGIADLIYGSFQEVSGVLKLSESKSIIHFIRLSEVQSVVVYEIED